MPPRRLLPAAAAGLLAALALAPAAVAHGHHPGHGNGHGNGGGHGQGHAQRAPFDRIVVVYEENHSFDNLYGGWERVDGLRSADPAHTTQVNQAGKPFDCLLQDDVNLTSPPLPATCTDSTTATT